MISWPTDLNELNHSELVVFASWLGLPAHRGINRELLLYSINNLTEVSVPNPVAGMQSVLSKWLKTHWSRMQMQAPKSACPNCHLCGNAQVITCYRKNEKHLK